MNEMWENWKRDNHNLYFVVGWLEVCDREGLELHADKIAKELKLSVDEVETLIDRAREVIEERHMTEELQQTFDGKYYYIDNLIYQNLLVILGEKFLYEWRNYGSTRKDFLGDARKYIKVFTGNEKYLMSLSKMIYLNSSPK